MGGGWHGCKRGGCDRVKSQDTEYHLPENITIPALPRSYPTPTTLATSTHGIFPLLLGMPITTRSKTKNNIEDIPPQESLSPHPKPSNQYPKVGPSRAPKNPEIARNSGANLLQTLLDKQEQELHDALGMEGHSSHSHGCNSIRNHGCGQGCGHGHGYSCDRGHGCGRGHGRGTEQSDWASALAVKDTAVIETLEIGNTDRNMGHLFIQLFRIHSHTLD